jgi:hypothetical protein
LEELVREVLEKRHMQITITKASKWNVIQDGKEKKFEKKIFGDYGKDLEGQIKIKGQIRNAIFQCKNWYNKTISTTVVREMESILSKQPNHIGIIIVNNGINERGMNIVRNSLYNIYVYDARDIINIVYDLHHIELKTQGIKRHRIIFESAEDVTFINNEIYEAKKIKNYICETETIE